MDWSRNLWFLQAVPFAASVACGATTRSTVSEQSGGADAQTGGTPSGGWSSAGSETGGSGGSVQPSTLEDDPNWEWVSLPAGTFDMGAGNETAPDAIPIEVFVSDAPVHSVSVSAFGLTRAEVTVAQYRLCVEEGACASPPSEHVNCLSNNNYWASGRDDHPVNCVTYSRARQFCQWAGGRLPTEAEWEYAARGAGQDQAYPWGEEEPDCARAVITVGAPSCGSASAPCECGDKTASVCSHPASNTPQGICDMTGNVLEVVADAFHSSYEGAPGDGLSWGTGDEAGIHRGGFFGERNPLLLRGTARHRGSGVSPTSYSGVRCAR